jgi:hypothetical protein
MRAKDSNSDFDYRPWIRRGGQIGRFLPLVFHCVIAKLPKEAEEGMKGGAVSDLDNHQACNHLKVAQVPGADCVTEMKCSDTD